MNNTTWSFNNTTLQLSSMNTTKKTETEKQLITFRNQMHNLLIRNPGIRISCTLDGEPIAWVRTGDGPNAYEKIYLPTSGNQELIQH
jgi:hypothetical protein